MRGSIFTDVHIWKPFIGLCLCIVLAGIMVWGTTGSDAASSSAGNPPEIRSFNAAPSTVKEGGFVVYSFEVLNAETVRVYEAGDILKQISSPLSTTLKGTVKGRTTWQIRTRGSASFDALLIAGNAAGRKEKKLTVKFDALLPAADGSATGGQTGGTENRTRSPEWLAQLSSSTALVSAGAFLGGASPDFYKCPADCSYCLEPEDAKSRGFTQRCSDQPCYYSPDKTRIWYCLSKPATVWCCRDGSVSEMTKDQCSAVGGSYYSTEAEALKACQALAGWYCSGGVVYQGTRTQAAAAGAVWYTSQSEAVRTCNTSGWCCRDGKYAQTTKSQCAQLNGYWFATQSEAVSACQQVVIGWFCYGGTVYQGTPVQAAQTGVAWYSTQAEAVKACQQQSTCWCCSGGKVFQTAAAACSRSGGACYSDQATAAKACQRLYLR